jgi:hypothetical protein
MDTPRDRRGRRRPPSWVSLVFCVIAGLERTAHSFSPSQRLHARSYPPIAHKHPRSLSSRFFPSSNLPGVGWNSKKPSQESSESFIDQRTNKTLSVLEKEDENVNANVNVKPRTTARAPSTRTILEFAIPAIGIWLCGPLMSIIDTSGKYTFAVGALHFLQTDPNHIFMSSCGPHLRDSSTSCIKSSYCCNGLFCFLYGTRYIIWLDPFRRFPL